MRRLLSIIGLVAVAMGVLWIAQGFGYVRWPASSFMIDDRIWVNRGAMLAAFGVLILITSRQLR